MQSTTRPCDHVSIRKREWKLTRKEGLSRPTEPLASSIPYLWKMVSPALFLQSTYQETMRCGYREQCCERMKAGVGEIGREYDRAGDYKIAEALHRRALETRRDLVASRDLSANLENQAQYGEAAALCQRDMARPDATDKVHVKLLALQQKQAQLNTYRKWTLQPLEAINSHGTWIHSIRIWSFLPLQSFPSSHPSSLRSSGSALSCQP